MRMGDTRVEGRGGRDRIQELVDVDRSAFLILILNTVHCQRSQWEEGQCLPQNEGERELRGRGSRRIMGNRQGQTRRARGARGYTVRGLST